jgi:uncharacterized membrane protein YhdT
MVLADNRRQFPGGDAVGFVLFWLFFAIIVGVVASIRGRSGFGWFLLSCIISPLLAIIVVALLPSKKAQAIEAQALRDIPTPDSHVKCPDCAELVTKEARVCKHCGCKLVPQP